MAEAVGPESPSLPQLEVGLHIWLHRAGRPALGVGTFELLRRVESEGSLNRAAASMGMAYSKAWQSIRRSEETLGFALLERQAGGRGGGGSTVSPEGEWLAAAFGALVEEAAVEMRRLACKHLGALEAALEAGPGDNYAGLLPADSAATARSANPPAAGAL